MKDCETRIVRTLKEKEQECAQLYKRLEVLESEKREDATRIEFLERMKEDSQFEVNKHKKTIELKKNIIEDLQRQLNKIREEN